MPDKLHPVPNTTVLFNRPLVGLTLLLVEDSRYASDAVRLLAMRSGARLRRADCLASAERHLKVYSPDAILIDLGLPDGKGEDLIKRLKTASPRIPAILALSGQDDAAPRAMAAGADGFMAKPISSMVAFQRSILSALPPDPTPRLCDSNDQSIRPDPVGLTDDLRHVVRALTEAGQPPSRDYVARFLGSLARSASDPRLERAAKEFAREAPAAQVLAHLEGLLDTRIDAKSRL